MSKNHLIIGLGGTGGRIIRAMKKTVYTQLRNNKQKFKDTNIDYLYVDSSKEMMDISDPSWNVLGENVQLEEQNKVFLEKGNLKSILDNLERHQNIASWIGKPSIWSGILDGMVGDAAAGQKRRMGRFLLATNIQKFNNALINRVKSLNDKGGQDVTFHICTGLAGGTGSGSIVDVICQIRKRYHYINTNIKNRIILYVLLPEEQPLPNWDAGNYHSNGYAALKELNALSVGSYIPYDIETGSPYDIGEKHALKEEVFNGCYLFELTNEFGQSIDVKEELPSIVSDYLFQKIYAQNATGDWGSQLGRIENAENGGGGTPEFDITGKVPERSRRFIAFGIKRLAVPEEEVTEYLTYSFAEQATLQLLYNNWADQSGFQDMSRNFNANELVQSAETKNKWLISDEHFTLSQPIIQDETTKKWKLMDETWRTATTRQQNSIKTNFGKREWLGKLEEAVSKYFSEQFRGHGVKRFFEIKTKDSKDFANEIRQTIEADLFNEWITGNRSIAEIEKITSTLISSLEERKEGLNEQMVKSIQTRDAANGALDGVKNQWVKVGMASSFMGKYDKLLEEAGINFTTKFIAYSNHTAQQFAKKLYNETIEELRLFLSDITDVKARLQNGLEKFVNNKNTRCNEKDYDIGALSDKEAKQRVIKFYEPDKVKTAIKGYERDEEIQKMQAADVRIAIRNVLGEQFNSFRGIKQKISTDQLVELFEKTCLDTAYKIENNNQEQGKRKLIGVNIIRKLKEQFDGQGDQELKIFANKLIQNSGKNVIFDRTEASSGGAGTSGDTTNNLITNFAIILPEEHDDPDFKDKLGNVLLGQSPASESAMIDKSNNREYEITLVSLANLFPLRYVNSMKVLKKRYTERIGRSNNKERTQLELHTEGDGNQFPPLFVEQLKGDLMLPYILLAKVTDQIKQVEHPEQGTVDAISVIDEDGFEDDLVIGTNLKNYMGKFDIEIFKQIKPNVDKAIQNDYPNPQKKGELKQKLVGYINELKQDFGSHSPEFTKCKDAAKQAIKQFQL